MEGHRTRCPSAAGHIKIIHGVLWWWSSWSSHGPNASVEIFHVEIIPMDCLRGEWLPRWWRLFVLVTLLVTRICWCNPTTHQYPGGNNGCRRSSQGIREWWNAAWQVMLFINYFCCGKSSIFALTTDYYYSVFYAKRNNEKINNLTVFEKLNF